MDIDIVFYNNTENLDIDSIINNLDIDIFSNYIDSLNLNFESIYLEYSFISSDDMIKLNIDSLNHDYDTDILSFDLSLEESNLFGNFYLSLVKIKENSIDYNSTLINELYRVIIHGFLHLIGFNDSTDKEIEVIRNEENKFLNYLNNYVPRGTV
jgi:rRNA maturation RNase YbeY